VTAPPLKGAALTCASKRRYPDEALARATAMDALERRPEVGKLYVYRCPKCNGWHLTKQRNRNGTRALVTADNPVHK
jgi:hypothetical protein